MAVPTFVGAFSESDPNQHPVDPVPFVPPPEHPTETAADVALAARRAKVEEDEAEPVAQPTLEKSKDGDVEATLKFRFAKVETGERVLAIVKLGNRSERDVWFPAAGEPNAGLAIVVQDAEGNEVRHVVEVAKGDQLPRRVAKLAAGFEIEIPILVVADGEAPLAPGTYSAYAELRPDAHLARTGLPLWTAPKGLVRSDAATLVVTPKSK